MTSLGVRWTQGARRVAHPRWADRRDAGKTEGPEASRLPGLRIT